MRLCGDYKITLNPNLLVDEHPLPTVEELFATVSRGETFSKLDLSQAFLQLEVRQQDRDLLTLSTHRDLFRPTRLMYGVASAPAIFQRLMEEIFGEYLALLSSLMTFALLVLIQKCIYLDLRKYLTD